MHPDEFEFTSPNPDLNVYQYPLANLQKTRRTALSFGSAMYIDLDMGPNKVLAPDKNKQLLFLLVANPDGRPYLFSSLMSFLRRYY